MCKVPARVCDQQPEDVFEFQKKRAHSHADFEHVGRKNVQNIKIKFKCIQSNAYTLGVFLVNKFKYRCGVLSAGVHRQQIWRKNENSA